MAFRFHVLADMRTLASQWPNPALARIAAITEADILSAVLYYRSAPAPVLGDFVAVPDYRELTASSAVPYLSMSTGCGSEPRHPTCNDYQMFAGVGDGNVVTSIAAEEPNTIDLVLGPNGSSVTLRRVGSYVGTTYFTYTARSAGGDTATGRVYVRVMNGA